MCVCLDSSVCRGNDCLLDSALGGLAPHPGSNYSKYLQNNKSGSDGLDFSGYCACRFHKNRNQHSENRAFSFWKFLSFNRRVDRILIKAN